MFVPVTLMIANCGLLFGPGLGGVYALLGALSSASLYYWIVSRVSVEETTVDMTRAQRGGLMVIAILAFVAIALVICVVVTLGVGIFPHVLTGPGLGF